MSMAKKMQIICMIDTMRFYRQATLFKISSVLLLLPLLVSCEDFNYEVEKRIIDHISFYLSAATSSTRYVANYRMNKGFENSLNAPDRDSYLKIAHTIPVRSIYYALEDGSISGYYLGLNGFYREPGNDGYDINDVSMKKYLKSCMNNEDGAPQDCLLTKGSMYIKCKNNCQLQPCPDPASQANCSVYDNVFDVEECEEKKKYCEKYIINTVDDEEDGKLGFLPTMDHCIDIYGRFTQKEGAVVKNYVPSDVNMGELISPRNGTTAVHKLGNCYYGDEATLVQRSVEGDYAYCGSGGEVCNGTFTGAYAHFMYDPRYRPWYIFAKEQQKPVWSEPYIFFDYGGGIGMTHVDPMYDIVGGKKIFKGTAAADYSLDEISEFLKDSYMNSSTGVLIYEEKEPHYVIAISSGSEVFRQGLSDNPNEPCSMDLDCTPVRLKVTEISGNEMDNILLNAVKMHNNSGYPKEILPVPSNPDDLRSGIYLTQLLRYYEEESNIKWHIIVASEGKISNDNELFPGQPMFALVAITGSFGFIISLVLFVLFFRKRKERAIQAADWRFTCAYILGSAITNCSTFFLLGPNSNLMCMLRMWSIFLSLTATLAPLLVKIWRIKTLVVSAAQFDFQNITNKMAALYTLPIIAAQVVILMFISIFDPPRQVEVMENQNGIIIQNILCQQNTLSLAITEIVFLGSLTLAGCILSYQSRNLDNQYGESKQLIFSMYNLGLMGLIVLFGVFIMDTTANQAKATMAIAIFWGTVLGTAAFVVPRLVTVRKASTAQPRGPNSTSSCNYRSTSLAE